MEIELDLQEGWVAMELREEFPHTGLLIAEVDARPGRTPREVRGRLRRLGDRFTGGHVVNMRQDPVPWAYRVFFRQIGLDPDERRTPVEALALERMRHGGFQSRNIVDDALAIATVETSVAVVAFDAERIAPPLGLRLAAAGELLAGDGRPLSARQIVFADAERSVGVLFDDLADGRGVSPSTRRVLLVAVIVKGVPQVSAEEALWTAAEVLRVGV